LFLGKLLPKPNLYTKFEVASFNGCRKEINRGSRIFLDAPLARTPANFGRKSCFLVNYSPSPSCIPNLKLLASTIAEINRGSQKITCSSSPDPINFGPESFFGKLFPVPKLCKKISTLCIYDDENSVFRGKNYYLQCKIWRFGG